MKITITINTDNAAFEGGYDRKTEAGRVLIQLVRDGIYTRTLWDVNGNRCGEVKVTRERRGRR
jgi:hypothetical protein